MELLPRYVLRAILISGWLAAIVYNFTEGVRVLQLSRLARGVEVPRVLWFLRLKGTAHLLGGLLFLAMPWYYTEITPLAVVTFVAWTAWFLWPVFDPMIRARRQDVRRP